LKGLGNEALKANKYNEAIQSYTEAITLDKSNEILYSNRSAAYLSRNIKGDAENALTDGLKCVEIKPDWAKSYSRKGAALHALKRYDDAIDTFSEGEHLPSSLDPSCHCIIPSRAYCKL
jgi:stress-induced-phosphoprotein 1